MKVTTFAKFGVGLAATATLTLTTVGAAFAAGPTATQEDPSASSISSNTLVGVGSDTIQDIDYGFSQALGNGTDGKLKLASWTATGGTSVTYRSGLTTARPNGSGPGYRALLDSIGAAAAGNANVGDVDFSRASGFQKNSTQTQPAQIKTYTTDPQAGVITEIPFAIDSISFAVPSGSPFLLTNDGNGLRAIDLAHIYDGTDQCISTAGALGTVDGTTHTCPAGTEPINAFVPKPGSGSRQFFLTNLAAVDSAGINVGSNKGDSLYTDAGTPSATPTPYVGAKDYSGNDIQEHDASALVNGVPDGVAVIAPFSGAKFLGYHNGVIADPSGKTAGVDYKLVPFDSMTGSSATAHAVLPYTGDASSASAVLTPNSTYITDAVEGSAKLTREVYNIIPTAAVATPDANPKYRALYDTFVGSSSFLCTDAAGTRATYGFMPDPVCGATGQSADVATPSTMTVALANKPVAGGSAKFTVTTTSTDNYGGKATVTVNGKAYTVTVPKAATSDATSTSATITVPTPKAGTFKFGAVTDGFLPTLAGVAASQESQATAPGSYTVAKATAKVTASAPKVSHTKAGKVTVKVTASGLTATGKVTVLIKKGTAKKGSFTKALSSGKAVVTLKKLPKGKYTVYVSYTGNTNINKVASKKLTTLTVS